MRTVNSIFIHYFSIFMFAIRSRCSCGSRRCRHTTTVRFESIFVIKCIDHQCNCVSRSKLTQVRCTHWFAQWAEHVDLFGIEWNSFGSLVAKHQRTLCNTLTCKWQIKLKRSRNLLRTRNGKSIVGLNRTRSLFVSTFCRSPNYYLRCVSTACNYRM